MVPLGRPGTDMEIANVVKFLRQTIPATSPDKSSG